MYDRYDEYFEDGFDGYDDYESYMSGENGLEGSLPMDCGPATEDFNYFGFDQFKGEDEEV